MIDRMFVQRIEWECQRLSTQFAFAIDDHDADTVAGLFTPEGVWHHQQHELVGRKAIRAAVIQRRLDAPNLISRHHYGNMLLEVVNERLVTARIYYTVYRHEGNGQLTPPRPLQKTRVGEYQDTFTLTSDGWRIASKRAIRVLEQP
jgi:hypothetical protein